MPSLAKIWHPAQPKAKQNEQARRRAKKRLYRTSHPTWRRIRAQQLTEEPLCRDCKKKGRITPGNEVDHIDGDTYSNDPGNLQTLCKPCHSRKTIKEQGLNG